MRVRETFVWKNLTPTRIYFTCVFITFVSASTFAWQAINPLNPDPFDGTHQLYTAIHRLLDGDSLGTDYVIFHGSTWGLLFLPSYLLSNGNIFVIEFAKYFFNIFLLPAISGYFILHFAKHLKYVGLYVGLIMIGPYALNTKAIFPLIPDISINREILALQSSAGIRFSSVFILIIILMNSKNAPHKSNLISLFFGGLVIGAAIDQGIYFTIGTLMVMMVHYFIFAEKNEIMRMTTNLVLMWAGWLLVTLVLSHFSLTGLIEILKFYFVYLPGDQRWFFGTWPADTIISWRELLKFFGPLSIILISIFSIFTREASKYRFSTSSLIAGQILSIYAIFSLTPFLMSYKGFHYLIPSLLTILMSVPLLHSHVVLRKNHFFMNKTIKISESLNKKSEHKSLLSAPIKIRDLSLRHPIVRITLVALTFVTLPAGVTQLVSKSTSLNWQKDIEAYSTLATNCKKSTNLWSDYPGYFMAKSGCKIPTGDLMIHALGERREQYQLDFKGLQPRYVETATARSLAWMPWLRTTNWNFYKLLYEKYSPILETSHSILWEKDKEVKTKLQFISQKEGLQLYVPVPLKITLPKNARVGYLRISYEIDQPLSYIPLVGTLGNYGLRISGSTYPGEVISLSPKKNYAEYPIFVRSGTEFIEITPVYNSPRFFAALRVKDASITWLTPVQSEIANFETILK